MGEEDTEMTYTEDEIEAAARAVDPLAFTRKATGGFAGLRPRGETSEETDRAWWKANARRRVDAMAAARAALSAVHRVPAGHWMAPDFLRGEDIDTFWSGWGERTDLTSYKRLCLGWNSMRDVARRTIVRV